MTVAVPLRVLYIVACAAPPVLRIRDLIEAAQGRKWDTCLILTPTAARWLESSVPELVTMSGHPVRCAYDAGQALRGSGPDHIASYPWHLGLDAIET
jgi:hypothetical protein